MVDYQEGNEGEEYYYRDVYVDGHCAYMDGESCTILSYDTKNNTVTLYNENAEGHAVDEWDGVFTIPYEQYLADFGLDWYTYK